MATKSSNSYSTTGSNTQLDIHLQLCMVTSTNTNLQWNHVSKLRKTDYYNKKKSVLIVCDREEFHSTPENIFATEETPSTLAKWSG